MKRKIFSVVLALVMLLTLAPMAVAAEETDEPVVVLPDGTKVVGIPTIDEPMTIAAEPVVHTINNEADLAKYLGPDNEAVWVAGDIFEITGDLNLEDLYDEYNPAVYAGLINFFYGTIRGVPDADGDYPVISGIPDRRGLIRYPIGGTIENLVFDHGTRTPYITVLAGSFASGREVETLTFKNLTVVGDSKVPTLVPSNYSPFVYTCPDSGIIMDGCVNEINMYGTAYSSIFFGYYPPYTADGEPMEIKFINCVNNGSLTTNRAGMFFGNSTGLDNYIGKINLVIEGCVNNGPILGFGDANYLCAAAAHDGEYNPGNPSDIIEKILAGTATQEEKDQYPNIQAVTNGKNGKLGIAEKLEGFTAQWNANNTITFTPATGESQVTKYTVTVGSYVNIWDTERGRFSGTSLAVATETITPTQIGDQTKVTAQLMAYGMANSGYGVAGGEIAGYATRIGPEGRFYQIENTSGSKYTYYASGTLGDNGQPLDNGTVPPDVVIVTAYGTGNSILQSYWITTPEAQ